MLRAIPWKSLATSFATVGVESGELLQGSQSDAGAQAQRRALNVREAGRIEHSGGFPPAASRWGAVLRFCRLQHSVEAEFREGF